MAFWLLIYTYSTATELLGLKDHFVSPMRVRGIDTRYKNELDHQPRHCHTSGGMKTVLVLPWIWCAHSITY